MYMANQIQDFHDKCSIQKEEEESVHQQTGLKFKEETSKVPKMCIQIKYH